MLRFASRVGVFVVLSCLAFLTLRSQEDPHTAYRVTVDMVALTFRVIDHQGKYISGLTSADFRIYEDDIEQKVTAFAEGGTPVRFVETAASGPANVFVLLDTSNQMYSGLPYVADAAADFVRRLPPSHSVAVYTFSRNLSRVAPLSSDHEAALAGLRNITAGDDTALFNAILLTLRDAARVPGRKVVVVFSNGPDNASILGPEDVGRVAENEGIPIYIVSTLQAPRESLLLSALDRLTERTGGKLYCERDWKKHTAIFNAVREDIISSYTAYYYPAPNPNLSFRRIKVEVLKPSRGSYRVFAREGYEVRRRM
jgi:VWFA-related protein